MIKKSTEEEYKRDRFEAEIKEIMKEDYDPDKTYALNRSVTGSVLPSQSVTSLEKTKSGVKEKEERARSVEKERPQEKKEGPVVNFIDSFFK